MAIQYKTISVSMERKVNLGNYESLTVSAALWASVDEEEGDVEAITDIMMSDCRAAIEAQLPKVPKAKQINVDVKY